MSKVTATELELLFPEREVSLGGKDFTIRPFSFVETRTVVRKLKNVLHLFSSEITPESLAEIYDKAFDGIVDVIAMTFQLDRKTVEKFDMRTALVAINAIIEVNKDFFAEQVEPMMTNLTALVAMEENNSQSPKRS